MQYTGELEQHFGHQVKVSLLPLPSPFILP